MFEMLALPLGRLGNLSETGVLHVLFHETTIVA